jgi:xylulokinase
MSTNQYKPDPAYHFLNHPTTAGYYMFMLCYKNGGLAREHIRDAINGSPDSKSWDSFNKTALETPPLGQSQPTDPMRLGLYFPRPEIVPNVQAGTWRFLYDAASSTLSPVETSDTKSWPVPTADARAILESQFLSLRLRSQSLVNAPKDSTLPAQPRRIYMVGGGAVNPAIADLAGQVLGGSDGVYKLEIGGNACALGASYKAAWGVQRTREERFEDFLEKRWNEEGFVKKICEGYREGFFERYGEALKGFEEVEKRAIREKGHGVGREENVAEDLNL